MTAPKLDYSGIKALSKALGRPAATLYALSSNNDPFYIGPARTAGAQWFADQWHRLNIPINWHYRRIHYAFISQDAALRVAMLSGKPYENTLECWDQLCSAARDAIALALVPQDAFVDHRNAEPINYLVEPQDATADITDPDPDFYVPQFPALPALTFDRPVVPQPYHIEVWAEKTSVNDILLPLAQQYRFNLVTGIGELTATRCREFVDRAQNSRRPARILYISDFDPGGDSMPLAVARKIEFEIRQHDLSLDVQLRPIALTHEQCIEHNLPRTPIKATERRAKRFEQRFGEGGTELDALEALHPGLLRRIVLREVRRYWNPNHADAVATTCEAIEERFDQITAEAQAEFHDELASLRADWQHILADIEAWKDRAKPIWQAITDRIAQNQPIISDIDWAPPVDADEDLDPLFDSTRSYVEQIDRYKRHQGKPTSRRRSVNGGAP